MMGERPAGRLPPGIHAMSDGAALHEQGRVLAILSRHGCRQPGDVLRLGSVGDLRETGRRDVVAFVHHHVAVVRDAVVHLPVPDQALNHGDVDPALELLATAAQTTDLTFRNVEKLAQPVAPLLHELLAVNENQGVDAALGDQPGGDDRLSECGRRGQNAGVVRQNGGGCHLLFGAKVALEGHRNGCSGTTLIIDGRLDAEASQQVSGIVQTPPRKPEELRAILYVVDDSRRAVGGEAHGLRAVELGILKRRQAHQPGDDAGREVLLRDVESVAEHKLDSFRKGPGHWWIAGPPRRRRLPRRRGKQLVFLDRLHAQHATVLLRLADERFRLACRHTAELRQVRPLVGKRIQVGIDEHAVAGFSWPALQRQGNQIAESTVRQRVLAGKEAIIGTEPEVGPVVHRLGEKQRAQPARETGRHGGVEEQPDVTAVPRPRTFERRGHSPSGAGRQIGRCVVPPALAVEVDGQEMTGLIEQHRVDAHREGLARIVRTGQVPADHIVGDRQELPVGTDGAPDSRFLAHTGPPLVGARRGIAGLAGAQALEAARINVLAPPKEGAEQDDLGLCG